MLALCVGQEPAAGHRGCIRPVGGRGSTCRLIACSTGAGEPSGGGTDHAGHGVAAGPTSRHLSTVRPNIIAGPFTPRKGGPVQRRDPPARYRYARPGKLASRHVHGYRQRQHGRDPQLLRDMLADDHLTVVHQDVRAGARPFGGDGPAVVDPGERYAWSRTKPSNRCGAASTASCPALASPLGSATNGCTSPLVSSVRIRSFTGRLAHRGSGPSVPSTRAATPSASPWTLRPVRHGACGRRSSRQRPPRTRPH